VNATSVDRIRRSYELLAPRMHEFTTALYARLFAARPDVRTLFTIDIGRQRNHFGAALALIVRNLATFDVLEETLHALGAGHALLGVRPDHYPPLCNALLDTLADALGPAWTPELAADWRALLSNISHLMLAGAQNADSPG
jgi:hemoglobin-like flavoprotein